MTTDLTMLALAGLLALVHIVAYSVSALRDLGVPYAAGARDEERKPGDVAGRLRRALTNFMETFPLFAAAVLFAHVSGTANGTTALAATIYVAARVLYLPLYGFGIAYWRSALWGVATAAILVIFLNGLV